MTKHIPHEIIDGIEQKRCSHCGTYKELYLFGNNKAQWDGKHNMCIKCRDEYAKTFRQKESHKEYQRKYYHTISVYNDSFIQRRKKYQDEHREENNKRGREYYRNNKEKVNKRISLYYKSPTGKAVRKCIDHKRRSIRKNLPFNLTTKEWEEILQHQNNHCAGCGTEFIETVAPEMDHIYPISLGGATTKSNIQALCRSCNSSKGNKTNWTYPLVASWT